MVKGADEMQANIQRLILENKKEASKAVVQVAEETKELIIRNIPVSSEEGKHLRDDIKLSALKMVASGSVEKDILYEKEGWRAKFPNNGTAKQAAQNFEEKTLNVMSKRALRIYAEALKRGL
ncbi:TPA: HK97 gp10 family phage protein [Listeria monocytogenes]|nr:HK97 gp10 family phage protein [Listeria monocytogenes]HDT9972170.1 HK97 gp10 family phage protein [Listeria monocytogenes]